MAVSRQTKVVEYVLQGNTSQLTSELTSAIAQLDALDQKLTQISTEARMLGGKDKTNFARASAISGSLTNIEQLRKILSAQGLTTVSPDQLNLLKQLNKEITDHLAKLNKYKSATTTSQKALEKIRAATHNAAYQLKKANIVIDESANKWEAFRKSVSKVAAIVGTIKLVLNYVKKIYEAAANFVETMNLFNVATAESTERLDAFAQAMAEAFNTDIGPIYNTIAVFRQYGNTMGFAAEQADILADGLTKLTYDLASLYNVSNKDMFTALKSGLAGQTKSMMRYGISVHAATLEQTALELGVERSNAQLSETEKVALRYISILKQASLAHGDLARTLESPQNQLKITVAQLQILLRNLGQFVVLLSQTVLPVLNAVLIVANKFFETLTKAAGYEIPDYSDKLVATNEMFEDSIETAEEYEDAIKNALAPLDEINQFKKDSSKGGGAGSGFGVIDPKILAALQTYDNLMDQANSKTDQLVDGFQNLVGTRLAEGIGAIFGGAFEGFSAVVDAITNSLIVLSPVLKILGDLLGIILKGAAWSIDHVVTPVLKFVTALTSNIWLLIGAFAALNLLQLAVTGSAKGMIAVKIGAWLALQGKALWTNIAFYAQYLALLVKEKVMALAAAAAEWWHTSALWQKSIALVAAGGAAALLVAGIVAAATSSAKANAASGQAGNKQPPALARGGVVKQPTIAMIGEGRYSEAVVPLGNSPQFNTMKDDIATAVLSRIGANAPSPGSTSGVRQPIILNINGRELARAILPDLNRTQLQTGMRLNV